ncbi:hypothetical protein [Paenibacillus contaminans]|uniref:Uncharacterized protein n=1 Tax=Paenibacillus contaminans TaxID=450362 RepID=A0A329MMV1_9BACL|nr:hypothetical protein [Paenibacillus contaminans]RAV20952.1 hypothetical protein DQG23_12750 [Paenibacillus contaminans]
MEAGFLIRCLKCGEQLKVSPGKRQYRSERIVFGTDNYGADQISCECGNALDEYSKYEGGDSEPEGEFTVEWRDISK